MESYLPWQTLPPVRGTVIRRDDIVIGFSSNDPKEGRRYLVIDVHNGRVRIVPLCTDGPGVFAPQGTFQDEGVSGYFIRWSTDVSCEQVAASQDDEHVSAQILEAVRAQWRRRRPRGQAKGEKS